jgi:glycosyltransferase involved in cell wall biosynthesis
MIRIAFVIDVLETALAGTEKQLLTIIDGLDKTRFEPRLICLRSSPWLAENPLTVPVETLSITSLKKLNTPGGIKKLIDIIKKGDIDIIHAHYFDSNILCSIAACFVPKVALLSSRRGFIISNKAQKARLAILRLIKGAFDGFVCNSQAVAKFSTDTEKIPPRKIRVIYNGIDLNRFTSVKDDNRYSWLKKDNEILIAATANLRPVKNIPLLVRAAQVLSQKYSHLRFVVIGEGEERRKLEALISRLGLSEIFHLIGHVEQPRRVLVHADIGMLTSYSESLSNALIEYSAMGLPVVASDVGGNDEVIENGHTGFLFRSNDLDELVEKLSLLIENKEMRLSMGNNGSKIVQAKFSLKQCLKAYEDLYEEMVTRTKRSSDKSS